MSDLHNAGITKDVIRHHFVSLANLEDSLRRDKPDIFSDVKVNSLYQPKSLKRLKEDVEKHNKFVVTTAVVGCSVDSGFYDSIKHYCKANKAKLLVLLAADPAANVDWRIDKALSNEHIVLDEISLNSNIFLSTIKLSAKHIDPTTGLQRIGQRNGSFIYASPKQRLVLAPVSNIKFPHALMTTGAITQPNYNTRRYMSERTAYIADNDHVMGAIVVEIVDDKIYHYRQIQADKKGSFIDIGKEYRADGTTRRIEPEALVLGDWHSGETDPEVVTALKDIVENLKPKSIVLHDAFNGLSINHHEDYKLILKAQRAQANQLNLENELIGLIKDLDFICSLTKLVVMVKSNHDEFLERYLDNGKYIQDPQNKIVSLKLALAMAEGNDPLKYAVEKLWPHWKPSGNIRWLKRDEDYSVAGVQLGAHGDLGANGAKGSLRAMEQAYSNSVSGHSHTPEILRGAWRVGTSSKLKLTYNRGASSWLHTHCLVYPNGSRQLINCFDGKWKL